jgi:hypothetical protein
MQEITTDGFFIILPENEDTANYLATLIPLRAGIYLDPAVAEAWTCDAERCRPVMGQYLCCKVQTRCLQLIDGLCAVHDKKPFGCALFPLDIFRIGPARVVAATKNPMLYARNWTRFDRDMLRCFEGKMNPERIMLEEQIEVLAKVFTQAEIELMLRKVRDLREQAATKEQP